jgi:site-specific DNA recombinase
MSTEPPAGYRRVSLFVFGSVSDEAQKAEITEEAKRRGLPEPVWYVDKDRSASDERKPRPDFDRLMADVKAGKVREIIARSSDRFVRRPTELESIIEVLSPRKVPVYFTRDSDYDLSTAGGRENARIKGAIARGEVERMSERMKSSARQRALKGIPRKGNRPFGYVLTEKPDGTPTLTEEPAEAEAIRWAFGYLMGGGTLAGVTREWNSRGLIPARSKEGWTWVGVKMAMLNPALGGFRYYQPTSILQAKEEPRKNVWDLDLIPGNWSDDSILTEQEWKDLRTVLTSTRSQAGNRKRHLGSGIYLCGVCDDGTPMKSARRRGELIYRCRESFHLTIPGDRMDEWMLEMLRRALVDRTTFEASFGSKKGVDPAAMRKQQEEARRQLDELEEAFSGRRISISVFERTSKRLEGELAELDAKLSEVSVEAGRRVRLMSFEDVDEALANADLTQRRQALDDVFPKVTVLPMGKGHPFSPEAYVRMVDRAGREWPTWFQQWARDRQLTPTYGRPGRQRQG